MHIGVHLYIRIKVFMTVNLSDDKLFLFSSCQTLRAFIFIISGILNRAGARLQQNIVSQMRKFCVSMGSFIRLLCLLSSTYWGPRKKVLNGKCYGPLYGSTICSCAFALKTQIPYYNAFWPTYVAGWSWQCQIHVIFSWNRSGPKGFTRGQQALSHGIETLYW